MIHIFINKPLSVIGVKNNQSKIGTRDSLWYVLWLALHAICTQSEFSTAARNSHTFLTCCQQLRAAFAVVTLEHDAVLSYDSLEQEKFTPELQRTGQFFHIFFGEQQ